jgi:hypothetical protein
MSGDNINTLKMVKEQPLNTLDLEYAAKLLEPFEDVTIERFEQPSPAPNRSLAIIAIGLILIINFPKIREKSGLNEYIIWLISACLLLGILY